VNDYINCPFCNEPGFDFIGLKDHFEAGFCSVYNDTPPVLSRARPNLTTEESDTAPLVREPQESFWVSMVTSIS